MNNDDNKINSEKATDVDQVVAPCKAKSYIIPLVYPTQGISIPTQSIADGLKDAGITGVDIDKSMYATLKKGNEDRKTPWKLHVKEKTPKGYKVSGIGHAGLCIIYGEARQVHYFEYGRYKTNEGNVRWGEGFANIDGVKLILEENCSLSTSEEERIKRLLSTTNDSNPHVYFGLKFEIPHSKAKAAIAALKPLAKGKKKWGKDYDLNDHHCYSFAKEMSNKYAGGKLTSMEFKGSDGGSVGGFMNKTKLAYAYASGDTTFEVPSFSLWADKLKWSANAFEYGG